MNGSKTALTTRRKAFAGVCIVALAVVGAAFAVSQTKAPPTPAGPLKLAVVDLDKVFDQSDEWVDYQEQRRRLLDRTRRSMNKYDRQLRILRSEHANLPPGTAAVAEKRAQIEAVGREFLKAKNNFEQQLNAQRTESQGKMFNKINAVLEQYARANKIDLVLKKKNLRVSLANPAEMGLIIATTDVLYVRDRFEVTEAIVKQLNAQYAGEIKEK